MREEKKSKVSESRCIEVTVISKNTGKEIEGTLCETSRGTYFKPKGPVEYLHGGSKKENKG